MAAREINAKRHVADAKTNMSKRQQTIKSTVTSKRSGGTTGANPTAPLFSEKYVSPVRVYDENGVDVTPLPLTAVNDSIGVKKAGIHDTPATPTDILSQPSFQGTTLMGTQMGGGPFSRSIFHSSQIMASEYMDEGLDIGGGGHEHSLWTHSLRNESAGEEVTEQDLEKEVVITLSETETIWIFELVPTRVNKDGDDAKDVEQQNENYIQLCKSRAGNDLYTERGMNTFSDDPKTKQIQTDRISYQEMGVMCTTWDMYDTYDALADKVLNDEEPEVLEGKDAPADKKEEIAEQNDDIDDGIEADAASLSAASANSSRIQSITNSVSVSVAGSLRPSSSIGVEGASAPPIKINTAALKSEKLKQDLFYMERCVNLNSYQQKLAVYRGFEVIQDLSAEDETTLLLTHRTGFSLERLWIFTCALTKPHNISCMTWNPKNPDILAVGYGQFSFTERKQSIICVWSLKNPEYPERMYQCPFGVTSLSFSRLNPNLLAAGLDDGSIAVYNVVTPHPEPIVDSFGFSDKNESKNSDVANRHIGAIWQICFVERDTGMTDGKSDVIISISTDGRVIQWTIRKGFEQTELMKIKRTANKRLGKLAQDRKFEALISRYASAMCFDFWPTDTNIYLVGTQDGPIHKCSCSYNEQFLETYSGHRDPVYGIHWSPFHQDVFLSCSADWTVRLWLQERHQAVLTFTTIPQQVFDCCWSPKSATLFACVKGQQLELWDLAIDALDPVSKLNAPNNVMYTTVAFSMNSDCLLVGDSNGQVTAYRLHNLPPAQDGDRLMEIINASLKSQLELEPEEENTKALQEKVEGPDHEDSGDDFLYD